MTQTRFTYDDVMKIVLPLAEKQKAAFDTKDVKTNPRKVVDLTTLDNHKQQFEALIARITSAQSFEKDANKLEVLNDAKLFINFLHYNLGRLKARQEESVTSLVGYVIRQSFWTRMPSLITDKRRPHELAQDILAKAEVVKQKQSGYSLVGNRQ